MGHNRPLVPLRRPADCSMAYLPTGSSTLPGGTALDRQFTAGHYGRIEDDSLCMYVWGGTRGGNCWRCRGHVK